MVLGIITAIAACPSIVGTTEAIRQGQRNNAKEAHRGRKANLMVACTDQSRKARDINGAFVVLRNHKLYITVRTDEEDPQRRNDHLFAGYFFPYPESQWGHRGEGFVSTVSKDPPMLNWIFVDKDTFEVKYGIRSDSKDHLVGPWTCTPIDRRVTFDGWEGFMAVQERDGNWALYFDHNDDGLVGKVPEDQRIFEIELIRKEMRKEKEETQDPEPS